MRNTKHKPHSFTVVSNTNPGLPFAASLILKAGAVSYKLRPCACATSKMGFEVVVSVWEAPWPVTHGWIHLTIKHVIHVRQFSGSPRSGHKHLEVQTEIWVGWRPGGKKNVLEVEADKIKYMVTIKSRRMRKAGHVARMGEGEAHTRFWWRNVSERSHLQDTGIDGRII